MSESPVSRQLFPGSLPVLQLSEPHSHVDIAVLHPRHYRRPPSPSIPTLYLLVGADAGGPNHGADSLMRISIFLVRVVMDGRSIAPLPDWPGSCAPRSGPIATDGLHTSRRGRSRDVAGSTVWLVLGAGYGTVRLGSGRLSGRRLAGRGGQFPRERRVLEAASRPRAPPQVTDSRLGLGMGIETICRWIGAGGRKADRRRWTAVDGGGGPVDGSSGAARGPPESVSAGRSVARADTAGSGHGHGLVRVGAARTRPVTAAPAGPAPSAGRTSRACKSPWNGTCPDTVLTRADPAGSE